MDGVFAERRKYAYKCSQVADAFHVQMAEEKSPHAHQDLTSDKR